MSTSTSSAPSSDRDDTTPIMNPAERRSIARGLASVDLDSHDPLHRALDEANVRVLAEVYGAIREVHFAGIEEPHERESAVYGLLAARHPALVDLVSAIIDATGGAL